MWKYIVALLILVGLYAISAQKVQATVVVGDTFETGQLQAQWVLAQGDPATVEVGNGKIWFSILSPQQVTQYYLNTPLPVNHRITYEMNPHSGADKNIYTKYFDANNWIQMHLSGNNYYFVALVDGQATLLDSGSYYWENGWEKAVSIVTAESQLSIYLDGQLLTSGVDPFTHRQGGHFSLLVGTGAVYPTSVSFDNVVIEDLSTAAMDGHLLNVSALKQHDAAWAKVEYDSASSWSSKTGIADWGCALTSAVMIMQYHGLTHMPDGQRVDPAVVNRWLKENNGYMGNGLVSFASLTVLSREISDVYGTPKLEYRRQAVDTTQIIDQLNQDRPVILQLPGHFVVGNGYTSNGDLRIVDPWYDYALLSQHSTPLSSYRTLTPSYTDLRMLELVLPVGVAGHVIDPNGVVIEASYSFEETITTPDGMTTTVSLIEVPQLQEGEYQLILTSAGAEGTIHLKSITVDGRQDSSAAAIESNRLRVVVEQNGAANITTIPMDTLPTPTTVPPTPDPSTTPSPLPTPSPIPSPTAISQPTSSLSPIYTDVQSLFNPSIHIPIPITTIATGAAGALPTNLSLQTGAQSAQSKPWCSTPTLAVQPKPTEQPKPITVNLHLGLGLWTDVLAFISAFASTAMAKN